MIDKTSSFWLKFDHHIVRFYGTPSKNYLRKHKITLEANNGYKYTNVTFEFEITNEKPKLMVPLQT